MMEHNNENDELVRQYREIMKKANSTTDEKQRKYYLKLAKEKHDEMIIKEFEDKNFKRFSY